MRQIVAMGGGGFSMEPDNPLLDQYILDQSGTERPKICFVPTASGDAEGYIERFYQAFGRLKCVPSHLSLFRAESSDLEGFVLSQDVIYVGGGNTRNLLALWREWGLEGILRSAWEQGVVLAGVSAGANCWFEAFVSDCIPGRLTAWSGLGWLAGSCCPHYDDEEAGYRSGYHRLLLEGRLKAGYGIEDGAALHFIDGRLHRAVASRPAAKAYRVRIMGGAVEEEEIETVFLGN
ncbi:peptidase E [Planifilum fimeticola]|jgi:dipeptidase E|uniref:Peptidase E n=1 Tax=Planifilum fimeticola TaxID=201975 RepID=A0A2T0LHA2_9BACL|nr:peptidase E [Planifilum fimeticola]PRX41719.1 peptidase E [Planifilum fimeticola]